MRKDTSNQVSAADGCAVRAVLAEGDGKGEGDQDSRGKNGVNSRRPRHGAGDALQ